MRRRVPVVAGLLVSAMLISLVGCGSSKQPQNSQLGTGIGNTVETQSQDNTDSQLGTDVEPETQPSTEPDEKPSVNPEESKYTYTELDKTMWTTSGLNVRDLPKTDGAKLGQLALGAEVHVTGQCKETNWYRIEYQGGVGYVSNSYLSDTQPEKEETPAPGTPNLTVDKIKDVTGKTPKKISTLYVIGNAAFQAYSYNDARGTQYAELVTKVADSLKGVSNVYAMPIPLGSGVWLPDEYKSQLSVGDQGAAIDSVLGHMGTNVIEVDIFQTLYDHRDEYLYFRTDHHWTQLAAYYAYTDFCKAKGITPFGLDHYIHKAYGGFVGSFYFSYYEDYKSTVNALYNAPDIVYTYAPVSNAQMTYTKTDGTSTKWPIIKDVTNYKKGVKYSCFIAGDNPYTIIENKDITDGSSCIVVKESYGNALVPLLVDHYQTIHIVDQRYWDGNVIEFAREHKVTDVIFANNLTAIGSKSQLANFKKIIE